VVGWEERAGKFTKRPVHHEREQRARAVVLFLPKDSIKLIHHVEEKEKKRKEREMCSRPLVFLVANDRSRERREKKKTTRRHYFIQ